MSRRSNDSNYLPSKSDKLSSMQATRADIQKQYSNASRRESRRVQKMNAMITIAIKKSINNTPNAPNAINPVNIIILVICYL